MTFREEWLARAERERGLKKLRMRAVARNQKAMARLEQAARDSIGAGPKDKVDFSEIDWSRVMPLLLEMLPTLIKILAIVI